MRTVNLKVTKGIKFIGDCTGTSKTQVDAISVQHLLHFFLGKTFLCEIT